MLVLATQFFVMVRKASILLYVSSVELFPFYQIEKWHSCVNCLGVVSLVFGLLFHNILMRIVNKGYLLFVIVTLTCVMVRRTSILLFVISEVVLLFSWTERRCRCVKSQ